MTDAIDVTVQHAIVHITNRNDPTPVCSEIELDLAAAGVVRDYFARQVRNALDDEHTGAARFVASGPQDAKQACHQILASHSNFIASSQKLALLLHTAMGTHPRISPGSLAVCVYTVADDPSRSLALIKLDPASGLVQKVGMKGGKLLVSFEVRENVMPTAREKLHKAALVAPQGTPRYDLLLLDHQTAEPSAAFWREAFLNAALIVDGKIGARDFYGANHAAYLRLVKENAITPAEEEKIKEQLGAAMRTRRVNRSAYVQRLPRAARKTVEAELKKKFEGTNTIPIDVEFAGEKLMKKTRYRGDYGFMFEVDAEHWDDVVKEKTAFEAPDGTPMTRLVLEVPRLQWVR